MVTIRTPDQLHTDEPEPGHKHGNGWRTYYGYLNEAKRLAQAILLNAKVQGYPYPYEAVLNFNCFMDLAEVKRSWKVVCQGLRRRNLCCLWIREPSRSNRVHYHLLIKSQDAAAVIEQAIRDSIPHGLRYHYRLHLDTIKSQVAHAYYICKAKISGVDPVTQKYSHDRWANKRLWFVNGVRFDKFGTVGPFWIKPKRELWQEIIEQERRLAPYLDAVDAEARVLFGLVGQEVSLSRIKRSLAYFRHIRQQEKAEPKGQMQEMQCP